MSQVLWVASYPKSGNTWMRFMLTSYLTNAAVTAVDSVHSFVPDFDRLIARGELLPLDRDPLLVKTHFLPKAGLLQLYRAETTKAIYVVRNPRDIFLSLIRHMGIPRENGEPVRRLAEDFIANQGLAYLRDLAGIGSWPDNIESWSEPETVRQHFPDIDVYVVRYEDLKADPVAELRKVVEFLDLGRAVVDDDVRKAAENSSIEKMREVEQNSKAAMPGVSPFGSQGQFVGEGNSNQSLAFIGDDVEASYRELLADGGAFSRCAKKFGYDS